VVPRNLGYIFKSERYISKSERYIFKSERYISKSKRYIYRPEMYISRPERYLSDLIVRPSDADVRKKGPQITQIIIPPVHRFHRVSQIIKTSYPQITQIAPNGDTD
jgi:hypothetical protein